MFKNQLDMFGKIVLGSGFLVAALACSAGSVPDQKQDYFCIRNQTPFPVFGIAELSSAGKKMGLRNGIMM